MGIEPFLATHPFANLVVSETVGRPLSDSASLSITLVLVLQKRGNWSSGIFLDTNWSWDLQLALQ